MAPEAKKAKKSEEPKEVKAKKAKAKRAQAAKVKKVKGEEKVEKLKPDKALEVRALARFVRISPLKARQVVDLIRGRDVVEATDILRFSPKGSAKVVLKVLLSAAANAEKNKNVSREDLYVAETYVNQGPVLKRFRPRAMGRAGRIRKPTSHIAIVLRGKE